MVTSKSRLLPLALLVILVIPQPVSAYLDPGFASMVWQMIAAAVFGAAFAIKIFWQKIKNFFSGLKSNQP
jgi:hypothetical protein